ncbi:MAG: hypothetical protein A3A97_04940 [Candidatus Terrybacteria bacterium RIFCSPLOWO2_01_FULL_40_23]|uniref:NIF system FeS cluster assembly NifU N-terminal domain-containing protein n=1 Tax=Candidatus Terrybacteria bacterium RIFCSPLOWO2_01_FULL_40_23 TaxID=1802366 RepID=A0A1G2PXA6_9BACT|nr:MAG: hypothetical protein A3A97_04940 [Candidatus Terrybacteria bacterium RIFCSPLOWO2_01_FULL_40_23]
MSNSSLYRQEILDHARNPRNFGKLQKADASIHEANLSCGDEVTLYLKYKKDTVSEAAFEGRGCILCLAGASMLTEKITGKKINDMKKLKVENILKLFGSQITPSRQKCALLSFEALTKVANKL